MSADESSSGTVRLRPRPVLVTVLAVGALVLTMGLGRQGLWDPWEMDRADLARALSEPTPLLVALSGKRDSETAVLLSDGADATGLVARIETGATSATAPRMNPRSLRTVLERARTTVVAGVLIDMDLLVSSKSGDEAWNKAWNRIGEVAAHCPYPQSVGLLTDDPESLSRRLGAARARAGMKTLRSTFGVTTPEPHWPDSTGADWDGAADVLALDPALKILEAKELSTTLNPWLDSMAHNAGSTVRFKDRGVVLTRPPLQVWITSSLFSLFGVSETTSRAGNALLAWLVLLFVVLGLRSHYGDRVAILGGLVLMTTPVFFLQGRSVVGEPGLMLGLTLAAMSLLELARGSGLFRVGCWLLPGLIIGFLSSGLSALLIVTAMALGWALVCGPRRIQDWLPAAFCCLVLGLMAFWVLSQAPDSFAGQFRFTQKLFTDGPTPYDRNFDWAIKRLGFGSLPWLGVGVIALAGLVRRATAHEDRSAVVIVLWLLVPTVAVMGMLKDFNLALWPAAPAMAVAVALLLDQILRRGLYSPLSGLLLLGITFVLLRELGKDPQPIVDILAFDPPFAEKTGQRFPDDLQISRVIRLPTLGLVALVLYHLMGLSEVARKAVVLLRRPYVYRAIIAVGLAAVPITWIVMASDLLHRGMRLPVARELSARQRLFHQEFLLSLDPVILVAASGLVVLFASMIVGHLSPAPTRKRKSQLALFVLGLILASVGGLGLYLGWGGAAVGLCALGVVLGLDRPLAWLHERWPQRLPGHRLLALSWIGLGIHMMASVSWPEGYWEETLLQFNQLLAFSGSLAYGWVFAAVILVAGMTLALMGRWGLSRTDCVLLLAGAAGLWLGTRLARDADLTTFGSVTLTLLGCLGGAVALMPALGKSGVDLVHRSGQLLGVGAALLALPILHRLGVVEHVLYPDLEPGALRRNILWGPLLVVIPVLALTWANRFVFAGMEEEGLRARLSRGVMRVVAGLDDLARSRGFVVTCLLAAAAIFTVGLLTTFQPSMAYHVSQKHIIDTYRGVSGGDDTGGLGDDIFRHGRFSSADGRDTNFYTAGIPELKDRKTALRLLVGEKDQVVPLETSVGAETRFVPGWDPDNDADGDGRRDHDALFGKASSVVAGRLVDGDQTWAADAMKGRVLVDARGRTWNILGNDPTSLRLEGRGVPILSTPTSSELFYAIDHPDASNHAATAPNADRRFLVLPADSFSEMNHSFRKLSGGRHIPILDGRSARVLLATNRLQEGEEQGNRLAQHTLTRDGFDALDIPLLRRREAQFDEKIRFLGYHLSEEVVARGKTVVLTTYYETLADIRKSYRLFLHIDQSGNRIHGDHWPLNQRRGEEGKKCVGCYRTDHWMKGDVVIDVYEVEVPIATPSGTHEIWMGWYTPGDDKRMVMRRWDRDKIRHDGRNRIRIGTFQVR